jgi:putative ABC transport system permease protein
MGGIARVSERFTGIASLVSLLGGLILTWLALSANVTERTHEIGLMKSVGWTGAEVGRYFLVEGILLSIMGAGIGLVLGWLTTLVLRRLPIQPVILNPEMPTHIGFDTGGAAQITLPAFLTAIPILLALTVAITGGALASWLIARRAASMKPADALRNL